VRRPAEIDTFTTYTYNSPGMNPGPHTSPHTMTGSVLAIDGPFAWFECTNHYNSKSEEEGLREAAPGKVIKVPLEKVRFTEGDEDG